MNVGDFEKLLEINKVTKEDVKNALNRYFDMDKMAVSIVKPNN